MANIMKIINFGSLNIDKVCSVEEFVQPGETIMATGYSVNAGGKGLNQSVAAARAGAQVLHAGAVGSDGLFLKEILAPGLKKFPFPIIASGSFATTSG